MAKGKNSAPGPLTEAIAEVIRARIGVLRTNKSKVAEATGIARTTLGGIIDGTTVYDLEQLDKVCMALGVQIEDVIKDAEAIAAKKGDRRVDSGIQRIVRK
jgi:DNA-binding Xre family transcriptional regulator